MCSVDAETRSDASSRQRSPAAAAAAVRLSSHRVSLCCKQSTSPDDLTSSYTLMTSLTAPTRRSTPSLHAALTGQPFTYLLPLQMLRYFTAISLCQCTLILRRGQSNLTKCRIAVRTNRANVDNEIAFNFIGVLHLPPGQTPPDNSPLQAVTHTVSKKWYKIDALVVYRGPWDTFFRNLQFLNISNL